MVPPLGLAVKRQLVLQRVAVVARVDALGLQGAGECLVEKVVELPLSEDEKAALDRSARAVEEGVKSLDGLDTPS